MIEYIKDPVAVTGEKLSPILWQGRQWAVTEHGIEKRDGTYEIASARLRERREADGPPEWLLHMPEKTWLDLEDFITTFLVACTLFGVTAFTAEQISEGVKEAYRLSASNKGGGLNNLMHGL